MVRLTWILFLSLIGLTAASMSIENIWQKLSEEIINREKLENKVKNMKKEIVDLKTMPGGDSFISDEMTVIREDMELLNNEIVEIKRMVSKGGGSGNLPNVTTVPGIDVLKQKIDENTKKILSLKSEVQTVTSRLKTKQDEIIQNLTRLDTESAKMAASSENNSKTINAVKEKQIKMENKQSSLENDLVTTKKLYSDLATEVNKIKNSLQEIVKKQNSITQANADIVSITADQKKLEKKQNELTAQQTILVKNQDTFGISLDNVKKVQGNFGNKLSNITASISKMATSVSEMEQLLATSNSSKSEIEKKLKDLGESQKALDQGISDLKNQVQSTSDCCKGGNGGSGQNKERLKGRMYYATAKPISSNLRWKASKGKMFLALVSSTYRRYARDLTILIASSKHGWFYVDNPYLGIKVNKTMSTGNNVFTVADDINVKPLSTERNSFWIETSHDVTLYLMSTRSRSSDGYHVLPYKSLAKNHVVSTTEPNGRYFKYKCLLPSFISVGATHDNTKVSFKLNTRGYITYNKRRYHSGDTLSVTLDQYDTFEVQHCYDLSGSFVTSSAPVAVVAGNQCNRLGRGSCSQLADMVPPIRSLSSEYFLSEMSDRPGSVVHIVAALDGTTVTMHKKTGSKQSTKSKTLNAGQFCETTMKKGTLMAISATRSVLVSQAVNGTLRADPMMLNVPGKSQFQSSYRFSVPAYKFKSFVSVTVESQDLSGLTLDGNPLKMNKKAIREIAINNNENWLLFSMKIAPGSHYFAQTDNRPFGLIIYGDGQRDGYAYSAGMTIKSG